MKSFLLKNKFYWFIFLPFWFYAMIGSMLHSGYMGDDIYNSQIKGDLLLQGITIWERYLNEVSGWLQGAGRFYPVSWLVYFWHYFVDSLILTKLTNFFLIYLGALIVALTLYKLKKQELFVLLVSLSLPVIMQFTIFMDPITAFTFLMPVLFLFLILSILFLVLYLEEGKSRNISLSFIFYLFSILTYEVAYLFWIIHVLIIYSYKKNFMKTLIKGAPLIILGLTSITSYFILQWYFIEKNYDLSLNSTYPIFSLHLDSLGVVMHAFLKQSFGIIPLLNASKSLYHYGIEIFLNIPAYNWLIFFICIGYVFKSVIRKYLDFGVIITKGSSNKNPNLYDVSFGVLLIFLSAIPVALSGHQQKLIERTIGNTYLTEYIQYYGVAIILSCILYYLITLKSTNKSVYFIKYLVILFFTISAALTMASNINTINNSNSIYKYPRNLLENSLRLGLLNEVGKDDIIIRKYRYGHDNVRNYLKITNKNLNICRIDKSLYSCLSNFFPNISIKDKVDFSKSKDLIQRDIYYIDYFGKVESQKKGGVFIVKISTLHFNDEIELIKMESNSKNVKIYNQSLNQIINYEVKLPNTFATSDNYNDVISTFN